MPRSVDHTSLIVHVQPRAKHTEVAGWHGDAVKIRLAAPPVDGAANEALLAFIARQARVPKRAVTLVSGATSRRKHIRISGRSRDTVLAALGVS
jgi:uncharacterized protein (TIGR00251 family)